MPIKKKVKAKAKAAAPAPSKKVVETTKPPIRRRVGGVRKRILKLLASGPKTRAELLKRGKFSDAALYLNLKSLRDEQLIAEDTATRKLRLASATKPLEGVVVEKAAASKPYKAGRAKTSLPVHVPRELHAALNMVLIRLSPIKRSREKLTVLQQLARTTPAPVSEILSSLIDDVVRLSTVTRG